MYKDHNEMTIKELEEKIKELKKSGYGNCKIMLSYEWLYGEISQAKLVADCNGKEEIILNEYF